jgi:tetratricopeptide (TPR) repeat protein
MSARKSHPVILLHEVARNWWRIEMPRITLEAAERLDAGISLMEAGDLPKAIDVFRRLIRDLPEHIDAYHHLALAYDRAGQGRRASAFWRLAIEIALGYFPGRFSFDRDRLPWLEIDNRPFLRAYHGLGLSLFRAKDTHGALKIFERLLILNPSDNQGARALVVSCHFQLNQPARVLSVCRKYPNDSTEHLLYGRPLALFQLGRTKQAASALNRGIRLSPLVAWELVRNRNPRPRETTNGAEEAFLYWQEQKKYWQNTPGAIQWAKDCLEKRQNGF